MKNLLFLSLVLLITGCTAPKTWLREDARSWQSQEKPTSPVAHSLFLVGDAGKATPGDPVMSALERQTKTFANDVVVYLGDNLYPSGLRPEDHPDRKEDEKHLKAQVKAVVNSADQLVFVPGNHDWEQGGKQGYGNVRRTERFVEEIADKGNTWIPDQGCPGPVEVPLAEDAILICIDTQWWLHKHEKASDSIECLTQVKEEFIQELKASLDRHAGKHVVVVGHHPMYSNGAHGGRFPALYHLFPLLMANKNLYIPLPVLGSIGILLRRTRGNIQDIPHPVYQSLKKELTPLLAQYPNATYACGHDHCLQYFPLDGNHYIVSGSGSKTRWTSKGKKAMMVSDKHGFVRMDFHQNGEVWAHFYTIEDNHPEELVLSHRLYTK